MYTTPAKEWTPVAEFIAALVDPPVIIPSKLAALLDTTILLRQSYSEDVTEILADNADQESNDRHALFLGILKNVRSVLTPLMSAAPAATKKPKGTCTKDIFNMFEHLELEKTFAAFARAQDATPALAPIYKAKRPNDIEEDFFALHLLLHDLVRLRKEVSHAWAGYKQGGYDLIAASITTNTAADLTRSMVEDSRSVFTKYGGAIRMLQIYYASQCIAENTTEAHKYRPGDDMNFKMFKIADALFWPAYILLNAFFSIHKVNPHPEMKPDFYGTYSPSSIRDRKSDIDKFLVDKILLLEMLPEFYFHCHTTKPNPPPVADEFTRLLRTMFETKEVTLPLVFAATLFLDVHHMLHDEVDYGFKRLTNATHFFISDIQEEITDAETKQRTLEELDYIFAVPTRTHMKYQATKNLPWWFNTYVLRRKGLVKPQLYKLGGLPQAPSVTAQMKYAWNASILHKKGVAKPTAREQYVAPSSEAFAEKQV